MSNRKRKLAGKGGAPHVRVSLACNGDGGVFVGTVEGIIVSTGQQSVDLEPSRCNPPRLTVGDGTLRVFRKTFRFSGWT